MRAHLNRRYFAEGVNAILRPVVKITSFFFELVGGLVT